MHRRQLWATATLIALCMALMLQPAFASVVLVYFRAEATSGTTINVSWETATELDLIGFLLYRSTTDLPKSADWGTAIHDEEKQGGAQGGGQYSYADSTNIVEGVRYYYLLKEVASNGELNVLDKTSAGVNLPAETATPTGTATRTPTATTATARGVSGTPTGLPPQPTATRRFTDAPATAAPGTSAPRAAATAMALRPPTLTPLPGARLATPTGPAPRVTIPVAPAPTVQLVVTTALLVSPVEPTATPALVAIGDGTPVETATPLPTKDATPVIFSSDAEGTGSPTPAPEQEAAQGGRSTALPLVLGGSAIGLAGLAVALVLFLRSRRS